MKIEASIKLKGGLLLSEKNMHRIVARSNKPCTGVIHSQIMPGYREEWRIQKDGNGFCWVEKTHGMGICGYADTVRELVIKTLFGISYSLGSGHIEIFVEENA